MGMLVIVTEEFFRIKKRPRLKLGSVSFPTDTGRLFHLSAGQ
jgi:hypothetical protein